MEEYCGDYDQDMELIRIRDPFVDFILAKCKLASVYLFDTVKRKEIDCNIHGECFIYNRNEMPHFAIQVSSREDIFLREAIVTDITWDIQDCMILYNKGHVLHSIMFHTLEDYNHMSTIFTGILDTMRHDQAMLEQASSSTASQTQYICPPEKEPNLLKNKKLGPTPSTSGDSKLDKKVPLSEGSPKRCAETSVEDLEAQIENLKSKHKEGKPTVVTTKISKIKEAEYHELPTCSKSDIPTMQNSKDLKEDIKKLQSMYKGTRIPFTKFIEIEYCGLPAKPRDTPKTEDKPAVPTPKLLVKKEIKIEKLEGPIQGPEPESTGQHEIDQALLFEVSKSDFVSKIHEAYLKSIQKKNN